MLAALLPAALASATAFAPAASAEFFTQRCTAVGSASVATIYTVLGKTYRPTGAMDYAFADVNTTDEGVEVCVRFQQFFGGYSWEGIYAFVPGSYTADATVEIDDAVAACPDELANDNVNGIPYRIATEETANSNAVCVTLGTTSVRVKGTVNTATSGQPFVTEDPNNAGDVYPRSPVWPAAGSESSQCDDPAEHGSTYVVTPNSSSFVRRDFSGSICARVNRPSFGFGGRVDTFPIAVFNVVTLTNANCDVTDFQTSMAPPLDLRIKHSSGLGTSGGFICAKANGTELQFEIDPSDVPPVPTVHLDA